MAAIVIDQIHLDNNKSLRAVYGDITERDVDVIVNTANSYLKHGGGVAAAIVRKGGKIIQEESDKIGFVPVGSSVIFGFPKDKCVKILVKEAKNFLVNDNNTTSLELVEFCSIDDETVDCLKKEFANSKGLLNCL